jgi:butyryl-CoA dehydrogenase
MTLFREEQRTILQLMFPGEADSFSEILESLGIFMEKYILPTARKIDREKLFPAENLAGLFSQGFASIPYPESLGGLGLPYPVYVAAMEMLGSSCASTGISIAIHGTVCDGLFQFGNEEQHNEYLTKLIVGKKLAAFCLTEPSSGSDAGSMKTKAVLQNGKWVINGEKMYITNSGKADVYFVFARTKKGPSAFLMEKDTPGFSCGKNIEKLGLRGSQLMALTFQDAKIPSRNLVGEEGQGFEYAKKMLYSGRITVAALSVGIAQMALSRTIAYCKQREAFGQPISEFEITKSKIADMITELNAARLLTYLAAWKKWKKTEYSSEAAQAKLFSGEAALRICNEAIQLHGGFGYTDDSDIHRHWRDARLMTIGEGTSEIMKLIIAGAALREETEE